MNFQELNLSAPILKALTEMDYHTPTPIQAQAIPYILAGRDLMGAARTGTGKTAAFTLPILERLSKGRFKVNKPTQVRALILTPTRELAAQVGESVATYAKNLSITSEVVFGGVKIGPQKAKFRYGIDVLVATPGRLLDLYNEKSVRFDELEIFVLDEADSMLDMGFIHDIKRIMNCLPKQRQNLMFSATFSDEIKKLAKGFLTDPVEVSVTPKNTTTQLVKQWLSPVDKSQKPNLLIQIIQENKLNQVLVFSRTKHGADRLARKLNSSGIQAGAIHGNKNQNQRTKVLADFKNGKVRILVATDIAARGLDIHELPYVINYDLPSVPADYVHRIGRTGRAGSSGEAISLVSADEIKQLRDIEKLINQTITRKQVSGFEPSEELPKAGVNNPNPKKPSKKPSRRRGPQPFNRAKKKPGATAASGSKQKQSKPKKRIAQSA